MKDLIQFDEKYGQFHVSNGEISYIFTLSKDGKLLHLHFGNPLPQGRNYSYLLDFKHRPMTTYREEGDLLYSLEHVQQEFPEYGTTDFRHPAISLKQENGSRITDFVYQSHRIFWGKEKLAGLPASYSTERECQSLIVTLLDQQSQTRVDLHYTIFADLPVITRSCQVYNLGDEKLELQGITSASLDFPDADFEWLQLSGAWGRERSIKTRPLCQGIQSIESTRGISSHIHNPFIALKCPSANEEQGQVYGACLVYSGNFRIQAEVDTFDVTRLQLGINPFQFSWQLQAGEQFTSPEAVLVHTNAGLTSMSQIFHRFFQKHLIRGEWRDKERPVLINNWEATYFDFDEQKLLTIAQKAADVGIELFVLDDGWFGDRESDRAGLGDWFVNPKRLPEGIAGLSDKIRQLGLKFGLWIEPEMVNKDSQLFREHPDWILQTPGHSPRHGRHQFVLDMGRQETVDYLFEQLSLIIREGRLNYIKWDMNRPLTDVFSSALTASQQGEVFHRYVLGLYQLYDRLVTAFPQVLFESCASGGGRFDPGLLYYAPQTWTSDDTDAVERLKIQYGTSLLYPLSSMGAHVSTVPNHQTNRVTPLKTRGNVALFGAFGYELDLNQLSQEELQEVAEQVAFYKLYRHLLLDGLFYRHRSPFEGNDCAWSLVSRNQELALFAYYKILNQVNRPYQRICLSGLNPQALYQVENQIYTGQELMTIGLSLTDASCGQELADSDEKTSDFDSKVFVLRQVK